MTLALRLARLPLTTGVQENLFQINCLGNALRRRRHYVTSSDTHSKDDKCPYPPSAKTLATEKVSCEKLKPENLKTGAIDPKNIVIPTLNSPLTGNQTKTKPDQAAAAVKDGTMQKIVAAKGKVSPQQVRENVRRYMFTRFFDYVKNYDKVLEKNFPSAMKVYRVYFDGVKEFFADMKRFLKVARIVNASSNGLKSLNRKELELYMQMPRDMMKVAPALIFSSLPAVGYVIFPLVVMYPRTFLTSHFWTIQQRAEFREFYFKERLSYSRPVFRCLQGKLKTIEKHPKYEAFAQLLGQLGSGTHPSAEQIIDTKEIFSQEPFSLVTLPGKHIKLLNKMHGMRSSGLFKRHRLYENAFLIHYMDLAIGREGGVHNMPVESLRNACYIRGLNPVNISNDDMINWLREWIKVSNSIQAEHITLFLHLPLFLGYNHPNNWQLKYGKDSVVNQQEIKQKLK